MLVDFVGNKIINATYNLGFVWVRKIVRVWKTKAGKKIEKTYYYWYKSIRRGTRVISECVGPASETDYIEYLENN
ncbi:MAG: hypothetical protein ACW99A_07460 [Candidatus Kariarchaeaceae archaeon]